MYKKLLNIKKIRFVIFYTIFYNKNIYTMQIYNYTTENNTQKLMIEEYLHILTKNNNIQTKNIITNQIKKYMEYLIQRIEKNVTGESISKENQNMIIMFFQNLKSIQFSGHNIYYLSSISEYYEYQNGQLIIFIIEFLNKGFNMKEYFLTNNNKLKKLKFFINSYHKIDESFIQNKDKLQNLEFIDLLIYFLNKNNNIYETKVYIEQYFESYFMFDSKCFDLIFLSEIEKNFVNKNENCNKTRLLNLCDIINYNLSIFLSENISEKLIKIWQETFNKIISSEYKQQKYKQDNFNYMLYMKIIKMLLEIKITQQNNNNHEVLQRKNKEEKYTNNNPTNVIYYNKKK